jgi:hypothetical protein
MQLEVPLAGGARDPFRGEFEWQLRAERFVAGRGGRIPPDATQVDCLTVVDDWVRFPSGTKVHRPPPPGKVGPGCARP